MPVSRKVGLETDPTRIGPYLIARKLGAGGMGTVYLARHEQTGQEVAVKVLAPSLAREAGLVARFMREIDALQKLKNPHVVEFYEHGIEGEMYYYAMEYVDGETLTARLRRERRLPWRQVVELSIQICVALKAAHDAGIIHRDLKPSNLLLTPDGRVKLTDFGVAHVFAGSKLTITGGIIGTAEYMSPEQGQGQRITKRSDLYSLGAVMYVMLTGRPPFSGKTTLDVVHKHKYGQFDRPRLIIPDLPHWIDEIVCQLMEKDPDKRFADAYVVNRRLQETLRKIELSAGEGTIADGEQSGATDMTTVEVGSARAASDRRVSAGPGPGTLMRDLFRAEIEGQKARGDLRRVFDNTLFLVGLLVVLVAGVAYWSTRARPPAEEADAAAVERGPASEIERLQNLARRQQRDNDPVAAERTLTGLSTLLNDDPQYETQRKAVDRSLRLLRERQPVDRTLAAAALERADELSGQGKQQDAALIWQSIIDLYAAEPSAAADVARARQKLADREAKAPGKLPR